MANSYEMSGPHIRQLDSIEKTMWNVVLALIPATFMSVYLFGTYALYLVAGTMLACMIVEIPFNMNKEGRQIFFGDGSAAVTGIILGLSLPPTAPWWIPILGGAAAILVGKQLFGGLGNNVFNPALVGRAILSVSWTIHMTRWVTPFDGVSTSTPLATPGETASLWELFIGTVPGSIGETSALALLIGAAYLYYRGYLDLRISIPYILAAAVTAIILGINPVYTILAGSLIIGAFFIATDMVSSPATRSGRIVYGIGCGVLTVVIRVFTGFPEGVTFAILLMNGFSHLFDTLFEGYIFGQIHLKKKRIMQAGVIALSTVLFVAIAFGALQLSDRQFLEPQHRVFNQHMHDFFPHADGFNMLEELHDDRTLAEVKQGGRRVGFLAYTERIGYDGEIQNMVAINPDGEVIGSKIIDHNESATLGAQIEREDFLAQFVGLRYEDVNPTIEAGDYELDAITNATLSSIAVAQTVETSLELVNRQIHGSTYDYFDLPSGYYRGTGSGWGGEMEVEVAIEDGFLRDINVISHNDTPHKARSAFERLKTRVISAQDTDVDVISGSTMSSNGMLEAIDDALASRHVEVQDADFSHLSDGRYKGSAAGHIDDIDVEIEVQDGELVDIEILHHEETTYLAEPALETLKSRVISEQNSRVELVSGATLTSRGFLAAVADAAIEEEPFAIPQEDDTYSGTAEGYQDDIEVEVTVENGEITDIQVIDHGETEDIAEPAFEELREAVISAQSIDVDTISGATGSSRGYLSAIENALDVETAVEFDDGVYTATGDGYQGEIEIEVVIEDGEIKEITVLDHEETPDIAGPAFDDLEERVIAAQSPNVDLVTNATGTSEGYLAAVEDILQTAGLEELEPEEPEEVGLQDGTFTGVGEGYNDDIEVEITVEDEEITEIEVISHSETEDIAEPAFEDLRDEVLDAQSTDVDTISGATGSSEGFLAAVDAARNEAREEAPEEEPEVDEEVFEDGTFTGIEEGYNNDIEIEVTLEDNEIVDIQVLAHEETEDIAEPAFEDLIDDVIAAQSTDVDTVSGATGSSEGFLTAVDDALDEASRDEVPDEDEVPEIGEPEMELSDGRFTGEAVGYNDDIALEVVIENGLIVGIDVLEHDETPDIAEPAFEEMKDRVVSAQSTDVDTVTEATGSSEGFLRALNVALTESQEELEEEPEAIYEPGEYTGVGEGYNDDIEVQITVD
ncbi:RnfABCDGE type electron transport complex subunit D, partial [Halarsenatibacter silvermanii]